MALYCTEADVTAYLPANHGLDSDALTECRTQGSADVDAGLASRYWPFPDVTADVSTPMVIRGLAKKLSAFRAWERLAMSARFRKGDDVAQLESTARAEMLEMTKDNPSIQVPLVHVTSEALAFGTDADYPDWHFFVERDCEVIAEATTIDGFHYGTEFGVDYSKLHRRWYLVRYDSEIVNDDLVDYYISYFKRREQDTPVVRGGSGELWRG